MKYLKLSLAALVLILVCSFTSPKNPFPPFTVHVDPYGTGCTGSQNNAYVSMTWTGGGSYNAYTDASGNSGTGVPTDVYVNVTATYGTHHGQICNILQTKDGNNKDICLNDVSCCIPNYKYFGCIIDVNHD